eukprot:14683043-Alexandrium_andersonii.AAC.1
MLRNRIRPGHHRRILHSQYLGRDPAPQIRSHHGKCAARRGGLVIGVEALDIASAAVFGFVMRRVVSRRWFGGTLLARHIDFSMRRVAPTIRCRALTVRPTGS